MVSIKQVCCILTMLVNRFQILLRMFHGSNNGNASEGDTLYKVQQLIDLLPIKKGVSIKNNAFQGKKQHGMKHSKLIPCLWLHKESHYICWKRIEQFQKHICWSFLDHYLMLDDHFIVTVDTKVYRWFLSYSIVIHILLVP